MKKSLLLSVAVCGLFAINAKNADAQTPPSSVAPDWGSEFTLTDSLTDENYLAPFEVLTEAEYNASTSSNKFVYYSVNADNTVTKTYYDYSWNTNPDKTYGDAGGIDIKYYKWQDVGGERTIVAGLASDYDLKVAVDPLKNVSSLTGTSGSPVNSSFSGLSVSGSGDLYGGVYRLFAGTTDLGDVTGDFVANWASSNNADAGGGAIYADGINVGTLTGNFIGNHAEVTGGSGAASGGALSFANNTVSGIDGNFIGNYTDSSGVASGGAITNYSTGDINYITADFVGNYASGLSSASGGAIYNAGNIGVTTGDFVDNYAQSTNGIARGGAIYNQGELGNINGVFVGNSAKSDANAVQGGAIYNNGTIGAIKGDFSDNYLETISGAEATGGAISNFGALANIDGIEGNFYENYINAGSGEARGASILNAAGASITSIKGDFVKNSSTSSFNAYSGGIHNSGSATIGDVSGRFIENLVEGTGAANAQGGAIGNYSSSVIGDISGSFVDNKISTEQGNSAGGVILNQYSKIGAIIADFSGNSAVSVDGRGFGGAIVNDSLGDVGPNAEIESITGNFNNNYAETVNGLIQGGAVRNMSSYIGDITGDFVANYGISQTGQVFGGAIFNEGRTAADYEKAEIINISGVFLQNYAASVDGLVSGGAIYTENATLSLTDASFFDNYAKSDNSIAEGGAVSVVGAASVVEIKAETKDVYFSGNYTQNGANKEYNALNLNRFEVDTSDDEGAVSVELVANASRNIIFNDAITSDSIDNSINISGDGNVVFNDSVSDVSINLSNGAIVLGQENAYTQSGYDGIGDRSDLDISTGSLFDNVNLSMQDGTSLLANNGVAQNTVVNNLNVSGKVSFVADVDLANKKMDSLNVTGATTIASGAVFDVNKIYISSDNDAEKTVVNFTQDADLAQSVVYSGNAEAFGKIYQYDVAYDESGSTGDFTFTNTGRLTPAIVSPSVGRDGYTAASSEMLRYVLSHVGDYHVGVNGLASGDSSNAFQVPWIKVYGSSEDVTMDEFVIENKTYSGIMGIDTVPLLTENGYRAIFSLYAAYLGSEQSYDDVTVDQSGAYLGGRAIYEKGNAFLGLTGAAGISFVDGTNVFGTEDYDMYSLAFSSKAGYNINLYCDEYVLQPSITLSYLYVTTPDYTNAAGVDLSLDDLHSLNITPELKFIVNFMSGSQAYIGAAYNWNVTNAAEVNAANAVFEQLSVDPYAEFKLGGSYLINDGITGFAEAFATTGGRDGFGGQFGIKWEL